jgi:hypothetical protein
MAVLDASPSRERLGRVVELLRGVEEDLAVRRTAPRRPRRRPLRPLAPVRTDEDRINLPRGAAPTAS